MNDSNVAVPITPAPPSSVSVRVRSMPKWLAIAQALAVCGAPTQILIVVVLWFTSDLIQFDDTGVRMSLEFIATVQLLDTALVALLIRVFLELNGEDSHDVFVGRRPVFGEMLRGLLFVPVAFVGVTAVVLGLRALAPGLHSVEVNPLSQYMRTPLEASIFMVVVVLGGGVKEELQRAFILRRFAQSLGGIRLGLTITTLVFGLLHVTQGYDAAIAIGLLGLFWGLLYAKRQSAVMSMTNHAAFDAVQVMQYVLVRALGG